MGVLWEVACGSSTAANNTLLKTLIGGETTRTASSIYCRAAFG